MVTLDKTKPYGVVCGNHHAKFEQDGKMFDVQGDEIKPGKVKAEAQAAPSTAENTEPVVTNENAAPQPGADANTEPPAEPKAAVHHKGGNKQK